MEKLGVIVTLNQPISLFLFDVAEKLKESKEGYNA